MIDTLFALTFVSALGCGLIAGVLFAFSAFVMKALAHLPPAQGIAAMQSINVVIINPLFIMAFLGTALACVALAVFSLFSWNEPNAVYLLVGSLFYLLGTFAVTVVFNVPWNDKLEAVEADTADGEKLWLRYVAVWTAGNHVRTAAALAAAASFTMALIS